MLKINILFIFLLIGVLNACTNKVTTSSEPAALSKKSSERKEMPVVAGGYAKINSMQESKVLQTSHFAAVKMEQELKETLEAYVQTVAGQNYRLKLKMTNGDVYEAVVFVDLNNLMKLTSSKKL